MAVLVFSMGIVFVPRIVKIRQWFQQLKCETHTHTHTHKHAARMRDVKNTPFKEEEEEE
jgi:hypothetical protein